MSGVDVQLLLSTRDISQVLHQGKNAVRIYKKMLNCIQYIKNKEQTATIRNMFNEGCDEYVKQRLQDVKARLSGEDVDGIIVLPVGTMDYEGCELIKRVDLIHQIANMLPSLRLLVSTMLTNCPDQVDERHITIAKHLLQVKIGEHKTLLLSPDVGNIELGLTC